MFTRTSLRKGLLALCGMVIGLALISVRATAADSASDQSDQTANLQEVIVTAQKRSERIQDVPIPVTAIQAETLIENNQTTLWDYYSSVPGLNIQPRIQSGDNLSIRGISTGSFSTPTVGIVVDDVPFGSSLNGSAGASSFIPDIDPAALARIEVLRGPQGTLYGASSMGGLIKYVTADPSTSGVSGSVGGGLDGDQHGNNPGYSARGSINVPLTDTLAVRASAFTHLEPGYVENPALKTDGLNEERVNGGSLAALWRPSSGISLKLSAFYQDDKAYGSSDVFSLPGFNLNDLQQNYVVGCCNGEKKAQGYSAALNVAVGKATITSITGYNISQAIDQFDLTFFSTPVTTAPYTIPGFVIPENATIRRLTQELRVSAPLGSRFDLSLGGYYSRERSEFFQYAASTDPASGATQSQSVLDIGVGTLQEVAGFADLTYKITDRVDVQVGARESHIESSAQAAAGATALGPESLSSANAFTYLLTPRFKISPDVMLYARLASGYRPGGANGRGDARYNALVPAQFDPDKTENYELGLKGEFADHKLSVDASLFYIDWKNMQLALVDPVTFTGYYANGSGAKSEGLELVITMRPATGLNISTWIDYNEAVLTQPFPSNSAVVGLPGDRLPNSSRWSGNLSVQQEFPVTNRLVGFVSGVAAYVGDREGIFDPAGVRQYYPAYTKVDLRTGLKGESWSASVYVNNVTDKRGIISGGLDNYPPFAFQVIQPRTVGVTVTKNFGQ